MSHYIKKMKQIAIAFVKRIGYYVSVNEKNRQE